MKMIITLALLLFSVSCASGKETSYTGSTPAGPVVKYFLGIPLSDSVDFIRWQLILKDNSYTLNCNYGIGKPNTNGFINDGKKIALNGVLRKEKNDYQLQNGAKTLKLVELNNDLLHLLDNDEHLLVGNGGWSYTLNNIMPAGSDKISITAHQTAFKDSITYDGRTPCGVPGVISAGTNCYKIKWRVVLYAGRESNTTGTYKILGTPYRKQGGRTGNWKTITGKNGRIIYQLNDETNNGFIYLLKLDEHILVFTDASGKLLVGDEDFSYTLNRINSR